MKHSFSLPFDYFVSLWWNVNTHFVLEEPRSLFFWLFQICTKSICYEIFRMSKCNREKMRWKYFVSKAKAWKCYKDLKWHCFFGYSFIYPLRNCFGEYFGFIKPFIQTERGEWTQFFILNTKLYTFSSTFST